MENDILNNPLINNDVGNALKSVFYALYYIDFKTNSFVDLGTKVEGVRDAIGANGDAQGRMDIMAEKLVDPQYKDKVYRFTRLDTVLLRMGDTTSITCEYEGVFSGWSEAIWILVDKYGDEIHHALFAIRKLEKTRRDELDTLYGIANVYLTMHVLNLVDDTCVEYKTFEHLKEYTGEGISGQKQIRDGFVNNVVPEYRKRAEEFVDLTTIGERLKDSRVIGEEFIGSHVGWIRARFIAVKHDKNGVLTHVAFLVQDIDAQKKRVENLLRISTVDELSGLYNRRAYESDIKVMLLTNEMEDDFVFVSIDVNGLKEVNDTYGHLAGDELISSAASCMKQVFGPYGKIYRIGGDEFIAIIYTGSVPFEKIKEEFEDTVESWKGSTIPEMTLSLGYAKSKDYPSASVRELGKYADSMMYSNKEQYYLNKGIDRRGQQAAFNAICKSYTKVLKVNLTSDTYQILNMNIAEKNEEHGFADTISAWLHAFGVSGQVHKDDLEEYLKLTDIRYLRQYFKEGNQSIHIFYRRLRDNEYRRSMMELLPSAEYSNEDQILFLYVKDIDINRL